MINTIDNPVYKNSNEIKNAIDENNRLVGIIEIEFTLPSDFYGNYGSEEFNDDMTSALIGERGYFLEDIQYRLVGCNTNTQTVFIEMNCDADFLIKETDWLSE